ncbi:hypothetical protein A0H81_08677 [Grifola frondosa]|uniref:Uncharacterized protein n=1 Tax=Grifola frondosa TaxID=5627 RepID=A0A1C7M2N4_GRIFR|nr:hypothetical protein A0H81_08677 [Grifola frondosa]
MRWDRAGAIATESFDIREHPELLCEFLWRFSQVSDQGRGYDMTVQMATEEEAALFKEAISRKVEEQLGSLLEKSIPDYDKLTKRKKKASKQAALEDAIGEHYRADVVTVISMFVKDAEFGGGQTHRLIISRPTSSPLSLASRATRTYWAFDTTLCRVVFLKDTWRYDIDRMPPEGNILLGLNRLGVRFVPELLYDGDVQSEVSDNSYSAAGELKTCFVLVDKVSDEIYRGGLSDNAHS